MSRDTSESQFLKQLQEQAALQAHLSTTRFLPKHADWLTTFIGNHPWQTLVLLSTVTTIIMVLVHQI
ncbi:hypothetical protein H3C66_00225 [Patescibacteria group bacterium]|nr:hypothetical protein [Patescibacteria group bacterium]